MREGPVAVAAVVAGASRPRAAGRRGRADGGRGHRPRWAQGQAQPRQSRQAPRRPGRHRNPRWPAGPGPPATGPHRRRRRARAAQGVIGDLHLGRPAGRRSGRQDAGRASTRGYPVGLEPVGSRVEQTATGTSRSAVSRRLLTATAERLDQLLHRPLGEQRWLVVFLDGFGMGEHLLVGALGVTADGTKVPLGVVEGTIENKAVCTRLVTGLRDRGLDADRGVLFVLDSGKALGAMTTVVPSAASCANRPRTLSLVAESRLPVGSSASSTGGSLASAHLVCWSSGRRYQLVVVIESTALVRYSSERMVVPTGYRGASGREVTMMSRSARRRELLGSKSISWRTPSKVMATAVPLRPSSSVVAPSTRIPSSLASTRNRAARSAGGVTGRASSQVAAWKMSTFASASTRSKHRWVWIGRRHHSRASGSGSRSPSRRALSRSRRSSAAGSVGSCWRRCAAWFQACWFQSTRGNSTPGQLMNRRACWPRRSQLRSLVRRGGLPAAIQAALSGSRTIGLP